LYHIVVKLCQPYRIQLMIFNVLLIAISERNSNSVVFSLSAQAYWIHIGMVVNLT